MNVQRRRAVRAAGGAGLYAFALACGLLRPANTWANDAWNKPAFTAKTLDEVLKALGGAGAVLSTQVQLDAPEIAENGAVVPVTIESRIPGTTAIALLVLKNPNALSADFAIPAGTDPYVSMRVKMNETSAVVALVNAGNRYFYTTSEVKVTLGGCGG